MARTIDVMTPEQVTIRYELAGFGSRAVATTIDVGFQFLVFLVLFLILVLLIRLQILPSLPTIEEIFSSHSGKGMSISMFVGLLILVTFLISWGYYILFETLWNGETPGKRIMRLRVIKDGGYPVDFRAVMIRNLIRPIDMLPGVPLVHSYGLAFVCVLLNPQYKRLGDLAAGTLVVSHQRREDGIHVSAFGAATVYRLLDAMTLSQLHLVSRDELRAIQRFLGRRDQLPLPLRAEFARRLAQPLIEKLAYQVPALGMDFERWLDEIDLAYRTRALGPVAPAPSVPPTAVEHTPPPEVPTAPLSDTRKW